MLLFYTSYAQNNEFYFIGEKISEEHCPFTFTYIPPERTDCDKNDEDERCFPTTSKPLCKGSGMYLSKFRVIKVLKGSYEKDTVEFYSSYCSEFGYYEAPNEKYVVIGLSKDEKNKWNQHYIEKIYKRRNEWILPYQSNLSYVEYNLTPIKRLEKYQRIKLKLSDVADELSYIPNYHKIYYKKRKKYVIALFGYIL
ncbi:hypothetical protein SAMN05216273_1249 [Chryseobacterium taihuense]|uniref:Uncharacterized protein n=1 Tax=Chryseobacterium taihuense TaxID=1141221 RepID=A0ABY0R330_9FLAO|nr:hypothetical protein SAMN05216273_1249 [Chryseobacterium taihuense]